MSKGFLSAQPFCKTQWTLLSWPPHLYSGPSSERKMEHQIFTNWKMIIISSITWTILPSVIFLWFKQAYIEELIQKTVDLKEALHVFSRNVVLHRGVCVLPHHVIDGLHDVKHLLEREGQKRDNIIKGVEIVRQCEESTLRLCHGHVFTSMSRRTCFFDFALFY